MNRFTSYMPSRVALVIFALAIVTTPASSALAQKMREVTIVNDPFQASGKFTIPVGFIEADGIALLSVPAGKRLVVEYASVYGRLLTGQKLVRAWVHIEMGDTILAKHFLAPVFTGTDSGPADIFVAAQQVRAYAEAGNRVVVFTERSSDDGSANVEFSLSGYLVTP